MFESVITKDEISEIEMSNVAEDDISSKLFSAGNIYAYTKSRSLTLGMSKIYSQNIKTLLKEMIILCFSYVSLIITMFRLINA